MAEGGAPSSRPPASQDGEGRAGGPSRSRRAPRAIGRLLDRRLLSNRVIVALAIVLTVVPVAVLVTVVPRMAADSAADDARRRTATAADTSARYLDEHLAALAGVVASYAQRPSLAGALAGGDPARRGADGATVRRHLAELQRARPGVAVVFATDAAGVVVDILPETPAVIGKDFSFRDWYRGVAATGRPYVSEVFTGAATGSPTVTAAAAPVTGPAGDRIGVLAAAYGIEAVEAFVEESAAEQGLLVTVTDQRGRVAARPAGMPGSLSAGERAILDSVNRGRSPRVDDVTVAGTTYLAAGAGAARTGWGVVAAIDRADALAGANRLRGAVSGLAAVLGAAFLGGVALLLALLRERRLTSADLRVANAEAMSASRVKSEFLANMSHEIRTPMNGVIGMTDVLLATPLTEGQREYAEAIRSSGEVLLGILNDILDLSKIEAGKFAIDDVELDLVATVEDAVAAHAPAAHAKDLEVAVTIDPGVPRFVRGDPLRLHQVLANLVGNAVKFTARGEVLVRVTCAGPPGGPATLRVEVCDTGIGIDEDGQRRLFRTFSQAEASTTRVYGGTGLGLAISKQLVEMMGGAIGVESSPGQGSTFWFTVPCRPAAAAAAAADPAGGASGVLAGRRVLVVDDNETNRAILGASLHAWGMWPATASGGEEALRRLREAARDGEPFTLALLDQQMPGMSGVDLARAVSADPELTATRMALLTSTGFDGDAAAARRAGVVAYLTKPVRQSVLYDRLAEMVSGRAPAQAPRRGSGRAAAVPAARPPHPTGVVLVAEDNEVNRRVATAMLDALGYRADLACDGAEAVRKVAGGGYAAVLMDCQMPVMDGYEAALAIRAAEASGGGRVPIIAMTANAMNGDEQRCLAAGMDGYLTKPVTAAELAAALRPFAAPSAPDPAPPASEAEAPPDGPVLDEAMMVELRRLARRGNAARFSDLVETYLSSASERVETLAAAVDREDRPSVTAVVHALKGSSATLGVTAVVGLCRRVEDAAHGGRPLADAVPLVAALRRELTRAGGALRATFPPPP